MQGYLVIKSKTPPTEAANLASKTTPLTELLLQEFVFYFVIELCQIRTQKSIFQSSKK